MVTAARFREFIVRPIPMWRLSKETAGIENAARLTAIAFFPAPFHQQGHRATDVPTPLPDTAARRRSPNLPARKRAESRSSCMPGRRRVAVCRWGQVVTLRSRLCPSPRAAHTDSTSLSLRLQASPPAPHRNASQPPFHLPRSPSLAGVVYTLHTSRSCHDREERFARLQPQSRQTRPLYPEPPLAAALRAPLHFLA
jgi:hypothetical protein